MSSACAPCRARAAAAPSSRSRMRSSVSRACTRRSSFARCRPKISTRRRSAASAPSAIRAPRWARRLRSSSAEIGDEVVDRLVGVRVEPPPHERELPPVRLVDVLVADRRGVGRHLELVALDRREQLRIDRRQERGDADRCGKLAHLVAVAVPKQRARTLERLADRVGARVRIAVGVAADPGAEAKRSGSVGQVAPVVGEQLLGCVDQALLEEPVAVADLVDDARPVRAHLVRLPERGDLRGELALDRVAAGTARRRARRAARRSADAMRAPFGAPPRSDGRSGRAATRRAPRPRRAGIRANESSSDSGTTRSSAA